MLDAFVKQKIDEAKAAHKRAQVLDSWQRTSEQFYVERASFTMSDMGRLHSKLYSSTPALARQEMGNTIRAMLRPQNFAEIKTEDEDINGQDASAEWLEYATKLHRKTMYRKGANFVKSTTLVDHDWVTFGQGDMEICVRPDRSGIFFKNNHLRDVAWTENYDGTIKDRFKQGKISLSKIKQFFPKTFPQKLEEELRKTPEKTILVYQIICEVDDNYDGPKNRAEHKFMSLWALPDYDHVLERMTRPFRGYVIPRAMQSDGTQYAYSDFTSIILPDARTKQQIERTLLEAGEKAVDPPLVAQDEVIRGDIGLLAGGITFLDPQYNESLGEAIRPLNQNYSGLPFGEDMSNRYDMVVRTGFQLDKINISAENQGEMTATQVRKIIEEQLRAQIPMFEPIEAEYNEPLCEQVFEVMSWLGAFPVDSIPEPLQGREIAYEFKSPIKDLEAQNQSQMVLETYGELQAMAAEDPAALARMKARMNEDEIVKDLLRAKGFKEEQLNDDEEFQEIIGQMEQEAEAQKTMAMGQQGSEIARNVTPLVQSEAA